MNSGPLLFARYAYPPNALGYCGPGDPAGLLEQASSWDVPSARNAVSSRNGDGARDIANRARLFEGAWPYLQSIAGANRISDPLDERVVEAYWVGNLLLERATTAALAESIESRFRRRAGRSWDRLAEVLPGAARLHHSFHVFAVYPWIGLLRGGRVDEPLRVLDQCRIRWGQVEEIHGDLVVVRSRPLSWDGHRLGYGPEALEMSTVAKDGIALVNGLHAGDWVSLHWGWICDRLSDRQRRALAHYSALSLAAVNMTAHPAPAAVLS